MQPSRPARKCSAHTGSSFDDFLDEAGIKNEVEAAAMKKVLAWQSQNLAPVQKLARRA